MAKTKPRVKRSKKRGKARVSRRVKKEKEELVLDIPESYAYQKSFKANPHSE